MVINTPGVATASLGNPDGLSAADAEAAWRTVTPSIAGTPHVRVSRDGGRTYPARHARPLPPEPPADRPCTVPVYDPGSGTGRMLALDLSAAGPTAGRGLRSPVCLTVATCGSPIPAGLAHRLLLAATMR